jgi:hypothetical protein
VPDLTTTAVGVDAAAKKHRPHDGDHGDAHGPPDHQPQQATGLHGA